MTQSPSETRTNTGILVDFRKQIVLPNLIHCLYMQAFLIKENITKSQGNKNGLPTYAQAD